MIELKKFQLNLSWLNESWFLFCEIKIQQGKFSHNR